MSVVTNLASWLYYEYHDEYEDYKEPEKDDDRGSKRT